MTNEEIQAIRQQYKYDPSTLKTGAESPVTSVDARLARFRGEEVNKTQNKTVEENTGALGKAKALAGGIAEGVGVDLPLMAMDYVGKKVVNAVGTEQMKENLANSPSLTERFNDVTNQTENPKAAIAGNVIGVPASLATGSAGVKAIPAVAKQIEKKVVEKATKAVGQIAQGDTTSVKPFQEVLQNIETRGVKTYKDLSAKMEAKKTELLKVVDDALSKDPTLKPISEYATKLKTKTGSEVSVNYVENALKDMKELYTTTGDVVKAKEIEDILSLGDKATLPVKTVNDIARRYGEEFGSKAFNQRTGDALTSVNAQKFENTRKGLKDVARASLGGDEAKAADLLYSKFSDAQKLVEKNVEAVNKLKQKIQERGWVGKAAYAAVKTVDTLSGGAIRGVTDAVLNRGTGLKTLNALDLEKSLSKNLKLVEKALSKNTEEAFTKALELIGK